MQSTDHTQKNIVLYLLRKQKLYWDSYIPLLFLLLAFVSVNQFSAVPIGNTIRMGKCSDLSIHFLFPYRKQYRNL